LPDGPVPPGILNRSLDRHGLNEGELAVCSALGIAPADYSKSKET
jgi:hypothetical protein